MAKLVDAYVSGAYGVCHAGSSPASGTKSRFISASASLQDRKILEVFSFLYIKHLALGKILSENLNRASSFSPKKRVADYLRIYFDFFSGFFSL